MIFDCNKGQYVRVEISATRNYYVTLLICITYLCYCQLDSNNLKVKLIFVIFCLETT